MIIAYRNKEFKNVPDWVRKAVDEGTITLTALVASVKTLEGEMLAWHTDMLIQGINGEIYPCKIDIFEATYEPFRRLPTGEPDLDLNGIEKVPEVKDK